jgi:hypothetical protein
MPMPIGQVNAHLGEGLKMRVGVPHNGGTLASHAFNEGYDVMVSASAYWRSAQQRFVIPEFSNLWDIDFALDSAGFTAIQRWQAKGTQPGMAGIFPWGYAEYIELANTVGCSWWSQPDLCCEPAVAANQEAIDWRIRATATLLEGCMRILYAWQNELAKTSSADVVANMLRPPVPVIQGWSRSDYQRSLDLLMQVWRRWEPWVAPPVLIGVGSVCRRDLNDPEHGLWAVLDGLEGNLPTGSSVHLFGVKGQSLERLKTIPWVASVDSMAWDLGSREKARKAQLSHTMDRRCAEMTRWMRSASSKLKPAFRDGEHFPLAA